MTIREDLVGERTQQNPEMEPSLKFDYQTETSSISDCSVMRINKFQSKFSITQNYGGRKNRLNPMPFILSEEVKKSISNWTSIF